MPVFSDDAEELEVVLLKAGRTKISYPADLLSDDGNRIVVAAYWAGDTPRDFGFVRFGPGDVFTEWYWRDRWYAVREVADGNGVVKGWYCDMTRPAVRTGNRLEVEDLDLDLWVSTDGETVLRLDEDEFEASGLRERDPDAAAHAEAALDELEALAREGGLGQLMS